MAAAPWPTSLRGRVPRVSATRVGCRAPRARRPLHHASAMPSVAVGVRCLARGDETLHPKQTLWDGGKRFKVSNVCRILEFARGAAGWVHARSDEARRGRQVGPDGETGLRGTREGGERSHAQETINW